jgi:undecaprenyl-diphosphatase
VALGLLHGPTELLPLSSSGHTALVPWLAGWRYDELDPELRKAFEVALHAGTAAALLWRPPWDGASRTLGSGARRPRGASGSAGRARVRTRLSLLAAAVGTPALAGYALGGQVERRLGTPATIAGGLLAGSAAMAASEVYARQGRLPRAREASVFETPTQGRDETGRRAGTSAGLRDGLALGLAQALALFPGVSRSGATVAAARARGFSQRDSDRLSWTVGLPVIAGAAFLKSARLAREGTPRELALPLAMGTASAFLSTLASTRALDAGGRARLAPACAVYRAVLALFVIRRMRHNTS